jgi:hypothetical protein
MIAGAPKSEAPLPPNAEATARLDTLAAEAAANATKVAELSTHRTLRTKHRSVRALVVAANR